MTIPPPLCHIKGQGLRLGSGIPVISLEDKWIQIIFVNRLVNTYLPTPRVQKSGDV